MGFLINLILSFVTGSIWITLVSIFSEKHGTRLGGAIAGIPSTMAVSLFFIGYTQGTLMAIKSTSVVPLMLGINTIFTIMYISLLNKKFFFAFIPSIIVWCILMGLILYFKFDNLISSSVLYLIIILSSFYFLENNIDSRAQGGKSLKYTKKEIFLRALLAGLVIMIAVLMSKIGGPIFGGVFAAFPAMTVSLMIITYLRNTIDYSKSLLKNFIISGTINIFIYIMAIRYTYESFGLYNGTIVSLLITLFTTMLTYKYVNKRMS